MNSPNDSALAQSLGQRCPRLLANRERLGVAYKALHSDRPEALDLLAALNAAIQDEFAGRVKGICLAAGMSEKQYQHVVEGLNGDGYPAVILAVLWQAAPHSMAKVMGRVFAPMGYTVARRTDIRPAQTAHESAADVAERSGALNGVVVRALSDGHMDEAEAARVLECVSQLKDAAGRMEAHARAIGAKK